MSLGWLSLCASFGPGDMCSWGWAGKGEESREDRGGRSGQGQGVTLETRYEGPHIVFQSVREEVWGREADDADHFVNPGDCQCTHVRGHLLAGAASRSSPAGSLSSRPGCFSLFPPVRLHK